MRFTLVLGLCLVASLGFPQASGAPGENLPEEVAKVFRNIDRQRFTGVRIVEFRRDGEFKRHEEFVTRDGNRLRIEFPEDSEFKGQIIVEANGERRHYFPDTDEIRVLPVRSDEVRELLRRLSRGPRFKDWEIDVTGYSKVAGLTTQTVTITDGRGNLMQRLEVHADSGITLSRVLFDRVGTQVGGFTYQTVTLNPTIRPDLFRLVRHGATVVTPEDLLRRLARENGFAPAMLPRRTGFRLEFVRIVRPGGRDVLMSVYRGADRLSLFQLDGDVVDGRLGTMGKAKVNTHRWTHGGRTYVLAGSLPEAQLKELAAKVSYGRS